jgi:molecular chaperone GrpE
MSEQENREAADVASQEDSSSVDPSVDTNQPVEEVLTEGTSSATASDTGESDDGDRTKELEATITRLEEEVSELKNQYLRKQADFENARRRMMRDKEDAVSFANQQLLLDLTSIIDDFERAIKSADESRDYDAFHNGVVIIEKQLTSMLERKWGLSLFDSEGEPFDPQKHEAVMTEPREDHDESIVVEDFQHGYMLHDRVLRSAKVKVSMPTEADS